MKKVIVTGGMGYIGSHTVVELIETGYEVVIIDNLSNSYIEVLDNIAKITDKAPTFLELDLNDSEPTRKALAQHNDAEGIIHFAALKAVGESVSQPLKYYKNNINSLINILEGAREWDIPNVIFSSSCTVYGQPDVLPVDENTPWKTAESPYGYTKQVGETIVKDMVSADDNSCKAIALRYFNPIGAHESSLIGELPIGIPNNLMPYITQTAAGIREKLSVFGSDYDTEDGTAIRDYIHVVDLAKAHVVALERLMNNRNNSSFEVFNVGTGQGYSVLDVIKSFERSTEQRVNYSFAERRSGDIEKIYASTTKANEDLGWSARYSLDDMTRSHWNWQKNLANLGYGKE